MTEFHPPLFADVFLASLRFLRIMRAVSTHNPYPVSVTYLNGLNSLNDIAGVVANSSIWFLLLVEKMGGRKASKVTYF